jgi:hypothetical protein
MTQTEFTFREEVKHDFDGTTYEPDKDKTRLNKQLQLVFACMKDGRWRSLREIADLTKKPEASVSARLRDLRKARFGAHTVERRRHEGGLFEYSLKVNGGMSC